MKNSNAANAFHEHNSNRIYNKLAAHKALYIHSACGPTICQIGRDNISRVSQFMILVKIVNFFKYSFLATCYGL